MQKIHILLIIILCFSFNQGYATDIYVPGNPYSLSCIDFDLDGDIDIIVGCNSPKGDTIAILLNNGHGYFEAIWYPKTNNFFYTKGGDMNGDSLPDIVAINDNMDYCYYPNLGFGMLGEGIYISPYEGDVLSEIVDLDNNGFNDLLFHKPTLPGRWGVVYNYGNNKFLKEIIYYSEKHITSTCSGCLNEDSLKDVLITSPSNYINSKVFFNSISGFIQSSIEFSKNKRGFISDLDNNNINDIALESNGIVSPLTLIKNHGNDNYEILDTIYLPYESIIRGFPDLNNDSFPDIFHRTTIPQLGIDTVYISLNDHQWGFLPPQKYNMGVPVMPNTQDFADLNGDEFIDLVLSSYGRIIKILWNDGTGHFVFDNPVRIHEKAKKPVNGIKAFPNPFSERITIKFSLTNPGYIELLITDFRGNVMQKIISGHLKAGLHSINWEIEESNKKLNKNAVYFFNILYNGKNSRTIKVLLIQ